jgi:hypothetical protein
MRYSGAKKPIEKQTLHITNTSFVLEKQQQNNVLEITFEEHKMTQKGFFFLSLFNAACLFMIFIIRVL